MNSAKIIAVTEPLITNDAGFQLSVDEFVAYVARVSNPSNQNNHLTANKLLRYLAKHKHWSPFEMVDVVMEINTTRDIGRQILRHTSFRFQEFSQRYADPTKDMGFVTREARLQDMKNRQNSVVVDDGHTYNRPTYRYDMNGNKEIRYEKRNLKNDWEDYQRAAAEYAENAYNWAIENGIAKEQARAVLPEGLTLSRMYMKGSLRSWITYIAIREKNGTQKEHIQIAKEAKSEILRIFPSLSELNDENGEWVI